MNLYRPDDEETIFTLRQTRVWRHSGLISDKQSAEMEKHLAGSLRVTPVVFRILFFVFTLLGAGAAAGLGAWLLRGARETTLAVLLVCCGAACYAAAEGIVRKKKLYRYGIEEALALLALVFCCAGLAWLLYEAVLGLRAVSRWAAFAFALGAFWIYLRFGYLWAAGLAAAALCWLVRTFSLPPAPERLIIAAVCATLWIAAFVNDRRSTHDFRRNRSVTLQACLLAALYLVINLHIAGLIDHLPGSAGLRRISPSLYPPWFYWVSCALTWLLPLAVLFYGMKSRKRLILNTGAIMGVASLVTNKSYLAMTRYSWDPIILGVALILGFLILNRWLNAGCDRKRYGYTAAEILKPRKADIAFSGIAAALSPGIVEDARPHSQEYFDRGASGGGGAQRDY